MKRRKHGHNTKRRLASAPPAEELRALSERVRYGGNPEHKRSPGDFGLTPPAQPRPDKSLCDDVGVFTRAEALELLQAGVCRGLISRQQVNGLPQNIWSVTAAGAPLEAQLENRELGTYHGYPLPEADPFHEIVLKAWRNPPRDEAQCT